MLLISKLIMNNWKSHEESELEFSPGTNGLIGIVGSGKTSVLDAICFSLFGTFPKLQYRKIKLDDVIMKKPEMKDYAEVEIFFVMNGNEYSVKRIIERGRGTSYSEIKENGKMLESPSTTNVTNIVENKLKVNYELFSKAIYSEQNSVDYFLRLGKGERMKKIDELLMINRFEKTRSNSVKLTNKLIERKVAKQDVLDKLNIDEIRKQIDDIKKSISNLKDEQVRYKNELSSISEKRKQTENEVNKLKRFKEKFEKLKRSENGLSASIETLMADISEIENKLSDMELDGSDIENQLSKYEKNVKNFNNLLKEKRSEYDKIREEFTEISTKIEFMKNDKIDKLKSDIEKKIEINRRVKSIKDDNPGNLDEVISDKKSQLHELIAHMESVRAKVENLQEQIEKIDSVKGECPVCGTKLSDEKKSELLNEKKELVNELREKIAKAKRDRILKEDNIKELEKKCDLLNDLIREISDLDDVKNEFKKTKSLLSDYSSKKYEFKSLMEELSKDVSDLNEKLDCATSKKQRLSLLKSQVDSYKNKKERISSLKSEKEKIDSKLNNIADELDSDRLVKNDNLLKDLISREKELEMRLSGSNDVLNEKTVRLSEYKKSLNLAEREREIIESLDRIIKDLKIFTKALKQTQQELRKEFIEAVNYTMNKLWETLYPYQDFIGIRLNIEKGDYVLQLQERTTKWVDVEGAASGGERSIACLALRMSFAMVLAPQLRWLVLDEPTHNLDSKSVEDLSQTLRERINDIVDQVFVITHDENLETAITGNLYRLERDKSKDEATKIISLN